MPIAIPGYSQQQLQDELNRAGQPQITEQDLPPTPSPAAPNNAPNFSTITGREQGDLGQDASEEMFLNLAKQGEIGRAGASQFHDRKYDNPASQKVYDDLIAARKAQNEASQKSTDSIRKRIVDQQKDPLELAKLSADTQSAQSKANVQSASEKDQVAQASQATQKGALGNQELQQKIDFAAQDQPDKLRDLRARASLNFATATKLQKDNQPINPTLAGQVADTLGISPEEAGKYTYGDLHEGLGLGKLGATAGKQNVKETQHALDKFNAEPAVKQAVKQSGDANELASLVNMPGNQIAQSAAGVQKVKTLIGGRVTNQMMERVGLQASADRFNSLLSRKLEGSISDEEQRELSQLAQETLARSKDAVTDQAHKYAIQYETPGAPKESLYSRMNPGVPANFEKYQNPQTSVDKTQASPEDKQALDWANANPSDPRAAKIKQRLGR